MKAIILILIFSTSALAMPDREPVWRAACDMALLADNPYSKLPLDGLLAMAKTIKDPAAWIELIVRLRRPDTSDDDKVAIRAVLGPIFAK